MFNITNPQRKANQDHNEIPPHNCQNGYKRTQRTNGSETVNWCSHCRKQYGDTSEQVKMELPYDPAIPNLGKYPKKKKKSSKRYIHPNTLSSTTSERYMHTSIHSSSIFKCQNMEVTQVSLNI